MVCNADLMRWDERDGVGLPDLPFIGVNLCRLTIVNGITCLHCMSHILNLDKSRVARPRVAAMARQVLGAARHLLTGLEEHANVGADKHPDVSFLPPLVPLTRDMILMVYSSSWCKMKRTMNICI